MSKKDGSVFEDARTLEVLTPEAIERPEVSFLRFTFMGSQISKFQKVFKVVWKHKYTYMDKYLKMAGFVQFKILVTFKKKTLY